MQLTLTRARRALTIATLLAVVTTGTAWAGCPSIDVENCEKMHEEWKECQAAKDALQQTVGGTAHGGTR